eukprot:TRINITY_DN15031_c0_g2_i1.p1 TRINITY_DN15031_c0_g2~~TRINITY_DN15031_c0_g2_i1.p1  ORF type:complete len:113 (+),score=13.03 TRINITY_DN15031_c0_g2_i1:58-396(+)
MATPAAAPGGQSGWTPSWLSSEQQGAAVGGAVGSIGGRAIACFLPIVGDIGALGGAGVGAVVGSAAGGQIGSWFGTPADPTAEKLKALERCHKFNAVTKHTYDAATARAQGH